MKKHLNQIIIFAFYSFIVLTSISCNYGTNDSIPITNLGSNVNAAGYPEVTGNYSFTTGEISYTCIKGNSGTVAPLLTDFLITQESNQLSAGVYNVNPPTNIIVIDDSPLTGNIEKTGRFIINKTITAKIDSIPGTNIITYNISGNFNFSVWRGDYVYTVFNDDSNDTCTYTTTFTGDYI
jgi:hypothetical protein